MKARKMILVVLAVVFCMAMVLPGTANAAYATYTADVVQAGYTDAGGVTIVITLDGGATSRGFSAPTGAENGMLAVALTAMSSGMEVAIRVNYPVPQSDIEYIRLLTP